MFFVHRVIDTLAIAPHSLCLSTRKAVEQEIDAKYPGKVWMDIGLVVARYTSRNKVQQQQHSNKNGDQKSNHTKKNNTADNNNNNNTDNDKNVNDVDDDNNDEEEDNEILVGPGVCVAGQAEAHVSTTFSLIVFRPFLEEVCVGTICASTPEGVQVSLGFFDQIFIPAYWMLRPTSYETESGLWVWTPDYDEEEGEDGDENENEQDDDQNDRQKHEGDSPEANQTKGIKTDENNQDTNGDGSKDDKNNDNNNEDEVEENETTRYEMELGSLIRFKVKSIQFARVTQTAKGRQATLSTTDQPSSTPTSTSVLRHATDGDGTTTLVRRRSSSVGLQDDQTPPPPMKIMASICEDGLGLVSWWEAADEEEEEEEEGEGGDGHGEEVQNHKMEEEVMEEEIVEEYAMEEEIVEEEVVEEDAMEEDEQDSPRGFKREVKEEST